MNWIPITIDDLKAAGHGAIIDAAGNTAVGSVDPVAEAIADAVSAVRGACSTGNQLDRDTAKVPRSLKALTERIALFALMERLQIDLTLDQRDTRKNDQSRLNRITDEKLRFELPDDPAGSAEMQNSASVQAINVPPRQTGRGRTSGL